MQGIGVFFKDSSYYSYFGSSSPFFTESEQHIRLRKLSSKEEKDEKKKKKVKTLLKREKYYINTTSKISMLIQ